MRMAAGLVIHDLTPEEWEKISGDYAGWEVVSDNGDIRPCVGCFSCWNRTPGKCVIKDGYENMGATVHRADEVVVISRYTYGGFSGPVKNIFDRCLGYVLPQFEVIRGETHHKKRYDEDKPFTFVFYGQALTDEEKADAERYVQAVCNNFRAHVKRVEFREGALASGAVQTGTLGTGSDPQTDEGGDPSRQTVEGGDPSRQTETKHAGLQHAGPQYAGPGRTVILNGSMRNISGNSAKLARKLAGQLRGRPEIVDLKDFMNDMRVLAGELDSARRLILCVPLYVDGLPSQVIRLMEVLESYQGEPKQVYVLANMGLYESSQLVNLFSAVRRWCGKCGFKYCGGLGISAGELLGTLMEVIPFRRWATKTAAKGMERLADAINRGSAVEDIYAEPYGFPRSLYIWIANTNWDLTAKKNGISPKDLYTRL